MNISDIKGKRVKILTSSDAERLEEMINRFIDTCDRPVWNIQYSTCASEGYYLKYSVLIIYG